jgi:CheY-like chemotaxis protein
MDHENDVEIVLIEDNPDDAELTFRAFRKKNLANQIKWLKDGEEALNFLLQTNENGEFYHKPKIILLDLKLPKIDGIQVLKELRSRPETHSTPVIVLTSSKNDRDLVESHKFGVVNYINKPVDFSKFFDCIGEIGLYWLLLNEHPAK